MHDGQQEALRRNMVAQAALVWGGIGDVGRFIRTGEVSDRRPQSESRKVPSTPAVERYEAAIRKAGRFIMPDEVDKWLASDEETAGQRQPQPQP